MKKKQNGLVPTGDAFASLLYTKLCQYNWHKPYICDHLSENAYSPHNLRIFLKILSIICIVQGMVLQNFGIMVSSFEVAALESRKNKEINLYSDW